MGAHAPPCDEIKMSVTGRITLVIVQNESSQDVPDWYADYFELKAPEILWVQEKLLPLFLTI